MTDEQMREAVLKAANRIMHWDYPEELPRDERLQLFVEDAELVAGHTFAEELGSGHVTMKIEGAFPESPPDTFRVEPGLGTFVLLRDGTKLTSGQLNITDR